jgi:hypothetical protein
MTNRERMMSEALQTLRDGCDVVFVCYRGLDAFALACDLTALAHEEGVACRNLPESDDDAPMVGFRGYTDAAKWGHARVFLDQSCWFERGCFRPERVRSVMA